MRRARRAVRQLGHGARDAPHPGRVHRAPRRRRRRTSQSTCARRSSSARTCIASITSENGTFGDTRSSICAVEVTGDRDEARQGRDDRSRTARTPTRSSSPAAAPPMPRASDQVLVLFEKGHYTLDQTGTWDTLGMRGTCSPGAKFAGHGGAEQILPGSFADSSAQTMVPYSHILWSALWWGIAAGRDRPRGAVRARRGAQEAGHRAAERDAARARARRAAGDAAQLGELRDRVRRARRRSRAPLDGMGWALSLNQLKMSCSEIAPQLVHEALQIIGIMAYKNDSQVQRRPPLPRRAVGGADGLQRAHRGQERVDAARVQGRLR